MLRQGELFSSDELDRLNNAESLPYKRIRDEYWDFRKTPASLGVYGIHPYPAMFHFLVVRELINSYSKEGDRVLDPFCGSGVVAVECLISNRNFIGYDLNPLAVLISKVRTTPLASKSLFHTLDDIFKKFAQTSEDIVEFHNINYWFDEHIIRDLSKLRKCVLSIEDDSLKNFYKVVFSEVVRRVSNTEYNEFKLLRKKKNRNNKDVLKTFYDVSLKNIGLLTEFYKSHKPYNVSIQLEERDILKNIPLEDNSIDLIITSPPYGDSKTTVAYGQFSRLSLRWLGLEEKVDKESLGSKPKKIKFNLPSETLYQVLKLVESVDKKRAEDVYSFYDDLYKAVQMLAPKVKTNGMVCFVVGNRKVKGQELPTDKICADFWESLGYEHIKTIVRAISNKRMPQENSPTNIKGEKDTTMKYEYIVTLRKK